MFLQANAQKELEDSWQVYAELQKLVEQSQADLVELIATRQREAERHAQELARGLENELSQLKRKSNELESQAQTKDKVVFLQVVKTTHQLIKKKLFYSLMAYLTDTFNLKMKNNVGLTCLSQVCISVSLKGLK